MIKSKSNMKTLSFSLGHSNTTTGAPLPSIKKPQPNGWNIQLEIHTAASLASERMCPDEKTESASQQSSNIWHGFPDRTSVTVFILYAFISEMTSKQRVEIWEASPPVPSVMLLLPGKMLGSLVARYSSMFVSCVMRQEEDFSPGS